MSSRQLLESMNCCLRENNVVDIDRPKHVLHNLSFVASNPDVRAAAAKFSSFLSMMHARETESHRLEIEALQIQQEKELNDLLSFTPNEGDNASGVVITHEVTEAIFKRHQEQIQQATEKRTKDEKTAEENGRRQFDTFVRTSAEDVVGSHSQVTSDEEMMRSPTVLNTGRVKLLKLPNHLKPDIQGARPKDPSLSDLTIEVRSTKEMPHRLQMATDDQDLSETKMSTLIERACSNHLGCVVVVSGKASNEEVESFLNDSVKQIGILSEDTNWSQAKTMPKLVRRSLDVRISLSTRVWRGNMVMSISLNDASKCPDESTWRLAMNSVLNMCLTCSCEEASFLLLPSTTLLMAKQITRGLGKAMGDIQMDFAGIRMAAAPATAISARLAAIASNSPSKTSSKPHQNLSFPTKLYVPEEYFHDSFWGDEVE